MFCPLCLVQHPEGSIRCGNCQVLLVEGEPNTEGKSAVELWLGDDPSKFSAIQALLDASEIPFHVQKGVGEMPHFRVWVSAADQETAERICQDMLIQAPASSAIHATVWITGSLFALFLVLWILAWILH